MKKWIKILLKLILGILLLVGVAAYISISFIDTSPYFETAYYKNTIENMDEAHKAKRISKGNLLAGFSKVSITPKIVEGPEHPENGEFNKIKMSGFGGGQFAKGAHDSIFAKAVALEANGETVVMVSADLLLMPESVVEKIVQLLKDKSTISRDQIHFGATHTHSSIGNCIPGYIGKSFGGEFQPMLIDWLAGQFSKVILQAIADKKPAQIGNGYIHATNLVRNRIIGETGRLNDKLSILSIKQDGGRHAAIGIFAAHATTIGTWNDEFNGDYPGYFQRGLESKGVDMAMFYAGTVGSHSNKGGKGEKFEKPKSIGVALADSAKVVLDRIQYKKSVELSSMSSEIEIPRLQMIRVADNLRLSTYVGEKLVPKRNSILLQGLKLNDFIWVAMPYEFSGEFAIDIKNALELKGYNSAFTSFNGQYLGYVVPQKYYYFDSYEPRLMGWYGPSMGDYLVELNYKLVNSLTESKL